MSLHSFHLQQPLQFMICLQFPADRGSSPVSRCHNCGSSGALLELMEMQRWLDTTQAATALEDQWSQSLVLGQPLPSGSSQHVGSISPPGQGCQGQDVLV